jgi:hypothetical protein
MTMNATVGSQIPQLSLEKRIMRKALRRTVCLAAVLLIFGCPGGSAEVDPAPGAKSPPTSHDHAHGAGPHGGIVAEWGGGDYHVEFTVDHDKQEATVYVLRGDASTPAAIHADELLLSINDPRFQVSLKAAPLDGEPKDASSRFAGRHENLGQVREFAGTISGEVGGTPYAGDFAEQAGHEHH